MKNKKNREPRDNERFQHQPELETPVNISKNLENLASTIKFNEQTPNADKQFAAEFLKDALDNPKDKTELLKAGFEAIPNAAFNKNVLDKNGNVQNIGGLTARYAINFGKDPGYHIAAGKDENGNHTIYIKEVL